MALIQKFAFLALFFVGVTAVYRSPSSIFCDICGKRGHRSTDCWELEANKESRPKGWKSNIPRPQGWKSNKGNGVEDDENTLNYLDPQGKVKFDCVGWKRLNEWLSALNGHSEINVPVPQPLNRGQVISELERRRKKEVSFLRRTTTLSDLGHGKDWRFYENEQGYSHLEELFLYQPVDWRKQAREYFYRFGCDLQRQCSGPSLAQRTTTFCGINITMSNPVTMVLFHPGIKKIDRYGPLCFLLSYGVENPLPRLLENANATETVRRRFFAELSPLDYFIRFQEQVDMYDPAQLKKIFNGASKLSARLPLINELDFSKIVGQRLAKHVIRQTVVSHFWSAIDIGGIHLKQAPLSMVFAGPSGSGKTELAEELAQLLNRPGDKAFHKVDCGKLSTAAEVFGLSGAYQGAQEGSSLNNFMLWLSQNPDKIGVILLDEFDKVEPEVVNGFFQVLDKGEWTNKKLKTDGTSQSSTIHCRNAIFIMTVNAADAQIEQYASEHDVYADNALDEHASELNDEIHQRLKTTYPFSLPFLGRVSRFIPFSPLCADTKIDPTASSMSLLRNEMMTITKMLIERERDRVATGHRSSLEIRPILPYTTIHDMAKSIVDRADPSAGVRSIEKSVREKISSQLMHESLLIKGRISPQSKVRFSVSRNGKFDLRMADESNETESVSDQDDDNLDNGADDAGCDETELY